MDDKERQVKKEEILHKFVKGHEKDVGPVDAGEVAAAARILKVQMGHAGIDVTSPKEIIDDMLRPALSETGADPSLAGQQVKERMEYEKLKKSYDRRTRRRPPRRRR